MAGRPLPGRKVAAVVAGGLAALLLAAGPAAAGEERPTLAELESEVMCPTCRTTLDQSSAPIAERMRQFIRARIAAGDTKSEIKRKLVAQFGDQVLASPPASGFNLLVWVLPPAGAVVAGLTLAVLARRWSRGRGESPGPEGEPIDAELERRVEEALERLEA